MFAYGLRILLGAGGRRRGRHRQEQVEAAAAAAHALHVAAAPGAGGDVRAQPLPRHGHPRGDLRLDQPHRGESQGEWGLCTNLTARGANVVWHRMNLKSPGVTPTHTHYIHGHI